MLGSATLLTLCLMGAGNGPPARVDATAADRIVLKDGSVVLGLITATSPAAGRHGGVDFIVRRAWAEGRKSLDAHRKRWDKSAAATIRTAIDQRMRRLEAWKRERSPHMGADDPILPWIDRELGRLKGHGAGAESRLIAVHLPANEIRSLERRPQSQGKLLRLAWLRQVTDAESMSSAELERALDGRGVDLALAMRSDAASLDRLLPPMPESDATWLGRRAATEVSIDQAVRFVRYNDLVVPDKGAAAGQPLNGVGLETAMSELKRLLNPDQDRVDPLVDKLRSVDSQGRVGAQVTRLEIAPDLSQVSVECRLLVRASRDRWITFGSRTGTVKLSDVRPDEGQNLAADPQVQGAFQIVEMLGLGSIAPDLKDRSLRMGAATSKAMGMAREAFSSDLKPLVLPVLEPAVDQ